MFSSKLTIVIHYIVLVLNLFARKYGIKNEYFFFFLFPIPAYPLMIMTRLGGLVSVMWE